MIMLAVVSVLAGIALGAGITYLAGKRWPALLWPRNRPAAGRLHRARCRKPGPDDRIS